MSQRQWTILVLWFAVVLSVTGQISNVTQCIPAYEWSLNSLSETPCLVTALLEYICGVAANVTSIPPDNHYLAPTFNDANPCECSSVTYSMISACGGCQNRTFIDWLTWSAECTQTSFMTFPKPIPTSVVVPSWAYLNLSLTNNTFNALVAQQNASNTSNNTSVSSTVTSIPTSSAPSASASASASAGKSKSNAGAIAGGVVGGLVLLAIIALVVLWLHMRRKRNMVQRVVTFDSRALVSGPSVSQTTRSMHSPERPSPYPSQSIYTSDMSTFPGSPLTTSGIFTTIPPSRRSLESVSLSVAQLGGGPQTHGMVPAPRGYTGMPEI